MPKSAAVPRVSTIVSTQLSSMPPELVELVMGYADWEGIMALRKTCRKFYQISFHRAVWEHTFLQNVRAGKFPRNFFLPRSLQRCSTLELESLIGRWQVPWPDQVPVGLSYKALSLEHLEGREVEEKHFVPGGRWVILLCNDGSTWSLDLADQKKKVVPRLLTPSPYDYGSSPQDAKIWAATEFDFISHHQEHPGCYHLHSFTFATATIRWDSDPGYRAGESVQINVWRIEVVSESPHSKGDSHCSMGPDALIAVEHLSSFREMPFLDDRLVDKSKARRSAMSLLGRYIAYPIFHDNLRWPCVAIVDWEQANNTTDWHTLLRWCIPDCYVTTMELLPNAQILVGTTDLSRNVLLYCWKRDCPDPSTTRLDV